MGPGEVAGSHLSLEVPLCCGKGGTKRKTTPEENDKPKLQ